MANKMISNIKSLTTGVGDLVKKVDQLYASLSKVNTVASQALGGASSVVSTAGGKYGLTQGSHRPGTGADGATFPTNAGGYPSNLMAYSLGRFNYPGMAMNPAMMAGAMGGSRAGVAFGVAQGALGVAGGMLSMMPNFGATMDRTLGYYQAALRAPGISRNQLERATFGAMAGGISAAGSDAQVAAILSRIGYTPGGTNYLQSAAQVGGAYKYLGMENVAAAAAIGGFQTGPMGANLFQYGITTFDPTTGKEKTTGQIARELMNYMTGGAKVTSEQVRQSFQRGGLGANLRTMGFSEDQQSILYQAMLDISSGRNPDLANATPLSGNKNTFLTAQGRLNASTTDVMMSAEEKMIKGFENAADTIEMFNRNLKNAADVLGYVSGYAGGVSGTPAGQGAGKVLKSVAEAVGTGLMFVPHPAAKVAGMGLMAVGKGGGTSGFGAGFGVANRRRRGGGSPASGAAVTAGYGAMDSTAGSPWAGTNGAHTGIDYAMPVGTPVTSAFDGVVSAVDLNSDYGTSIMVDNMNGTQAIYGHLSEKRVKVGDQISQGQVIGKSGESGNAGGPHLHFEVRDGKNHPVNPASVLSGGDYGGKLFGNYASINAIGLGGSPGSTGATKSILGTGDQQAWARDFLTRLGKPVTDDNLRAITTWMAFEGGHWKNSANYNPLNTTLGAPGASSMNSAGVRSYQSYEQGMQATLDTIRANKYGYPAILDALESGSNFQGVVNAVNSSKWGTTIRGGATTGYGAAVTSPIASGNRTVNVTLKIERASEQEALHFAKKVKFYLEQDNEISMIGKS